MKKINVKYVLISICIIIVLGMLFYINILIRKNKAEASNNLNFSIKKVYFDENSITGGQMAVIPKWEDMTNAQRYHYAKFFGIYDSKNTKIKNELIGNELGISILSSNDTYTNTKHDIEVKIYEIKDFTKECAIAIQFDNDNDYYVYTNEYYRPETLGQFIKDLKLKETVKFNSIFYNYSYKDKEGYYHYDKIEFPDVKDDIIWEMLFSDETLQNVHKDEDNHNILMEISIDMPLFGYKNISVSISEDGFLTTNIFSTGKTFYVGEEKVQNFVNHILENYEGFKTIYVDKDGNEIIYDIITGDEEIEAIDDSIMMYTNNLNQSIQVNNIISSKENFVEEYRGISD